MTITNENCIITVTGNGAQTIFNYGFLVPLTSGFELILTDTTTGAQSVLSTAVYSVSGQGVATGGTFTYPLVGSPIASTQTLTFVRQLAAEQTTNFGNQNGYYPEVVEAALDALTMEIQQLKAQLARCIQQPLVDTTLLTTLPAAAARANKTMSFDSTGQLVVA
jgi:hypothetical protein